MAVLEYCPESTRVLPREYCSTFTEVLQHFFPKDRLPSKQLPTSAHPPKIPTIHQKVKGETKNARKNNRAHAYKRKKNMKERKSTPHQQVRQNHQQPFPCFEGIAIHGHSQSPIKPLSKSPHTIWCERSHHLIRALTPFDVSAHIKWCEITFSAFRKDFMPIPIALTLKPRAKRKNKRK